MVYREMYPGPPLSPSVSMLWYLRTPHPAAGRQRVLPSGRAELILNLGADFCTDCSFPGGFCKQSPTLLSGLRSSASEIDQRDMAELMGVSFAPGALGMFFRESAHRLHGDVALEDLWGAGPVSRLRTRLQETPELHKRFSLLERFLTARLRPSSMHPGVRRALAYAHIEGRTGMCTVAALARIAELSPRRFGELFASSVGFAPKMYLRLHRFRAAIADLHGGREPRWAELALDLGFCDQSHLNRDFRHFSGLTPGEYVAAHRPWAGHVVLPDGAPASDFSKPTQS